MDEEKIVQLLKECKPLLDQIKGCREKLVPDGHLSIYIGDNASWADIDDYTLIMLGDTVNIERMPEGKPARVICEVE